MLWCIGSTYLVLPWCFLSLVTSIAIDPNGSQDLGAPSSSHSLPRSGCECYAAAALPWELSVATTGGQSGKKPMVKPKSPHLWDLGSRVETVGFRRKDCGSLRNVWIAAETICLRIPNSNFQERKWGVQKTDWKIHRAWHTKLYHQKNRCWRNFKEEYTLHMED